MEIQVTTTNFDRQNSFAICEYVYTCIITRQVNNNAYIVGSLIKT